MSVDKRSGIVGFSVLKWLVPVFVFAAIVSEPRASVGDSVPDDLGDPRAVLDSAGKQFADLERAYADMSGEATWTTVIRSREGEIKERRSRSIEFARSNGMEKLDMLRTDDNPPRTIPGRKADDLRNSIPRPRGMAYLHDDKQAFELTRLTADSGYAVKQQSDDIDAARKAIEMQIGRVWECAIRPGFSRFSQMFALKSLRWDRVDPIAADGKRLLKFTYHFTYDQPSAKNVLRADYGWFILSPDDHWAVHSCSVNLPNADGSSIEEVQTVEFGAARDGIPIPSRAIRKQVYHFLKDGKPDPTGAVVGEDTFDFTAFKLGKVPLREFTTASFGLPDFGKVAAPPSPIRLHHVLLLLAFLTALIAVAIRWSSRRQARQSPAPTA